MTGFYMEHNSGLTWVNLVCIKDDHQGQMILEIIRDDPLRRWEKEQ